MMKYLTCRRSDGLNCWDVYFTKEGKETLNPIEAFKASDRELEEQRKLVHLNKAGFCYTHLKIKEEEEL